MEQRPLRLGDLVDDYCPRERRLTNHAVVAIIGDEIKQTRCSTCEAEHPYKDGKVPRRRKKDANGEAYDQVLAGVTGQLVAAAPAASTASTTPVETVGAEIVIERAASPAEPQPAVNGAASPEPAVAGAAGAAGNDDLWPAHRPLIRAQLPRTEGQQPAQPQRPIHEFTMRQHNGRGNQSFRGGQGWNDRGGQNGDGRGNGRGGGFRHGKFGGGAGGGRPNANGGGRPKRSR
jgi:hypothetical protein